MKNEKKLDKTWKFKNGSSIIKEDGPGRYESSDKSLQWLQIEKMEDKECQ